VEIGGPGLVRQLSPSQQAGMVAAFGWIGGLVAYGATKIKTVVRVQAAGCELFFLNESAEPDALRIQLARGLGAIRDAHATLSESAEHREAARSGSPVEELSKLASMLDSGLLTREEFDRLRARLLADS
jgi:Short C-terminal domain